MAASAHLDLHQMMALRTPHLSIHEGLDVLWSAKSSDAALAIIQKLYAQKTVQEALWISDPKFAQEVFKDGKLQPSEPIVYDSARFHHLYRFILRISSRPSPIGSSAGVSSGRITGDEDRFEIAKREEWRFKSRPDDRLTYYAWSALLGRPETFSRLRWKVNPTVAIFSNRIQYYEDLTDGLLKIHPKLTTVSLTEPLKAVLQEFQTWTDWSDIIKILSKLFKENKLPREWQASQYAVSLVRSQILLPDIIPSVVLKKWTHQRLIKRIQNLGSADQYTKPLELAYQASREISESKLGGGLQILKQFHQAVDEFGSQTNLDLRARQRIQVDLFKPSPNLNVSRKWEAKIEKAMRGLAALMDFRGSVSERLVDRFVARFGNEAVPFAEVFDPHVGLSPEWLQSGLPGYLPPQSVQEGAPSRQWFEKEIMQRTLNSGAREDSDPWVLDLEKIFPKNWEKKIAWPYPDSFSVTGCMVGPDQFHLKWVNAGNGLRLVGRFLNLDKALLSEAKAVVDAEQKRYPERIFAELVYVDHQRVGNYNSRPSILKYDLVLAQRSEKAAEHQIFISDLTVQAKGKFLELRCPKLGNRLVIPRLMSAQNFGTFENPYAKFLGLFQEPFHEMGYMWQWQRFEGRRRLPRIQVGNIILTFQEWNLSKKEMARLGSAEYRKRLGVPRFIKFANGEHELPVDLENPVSLRNAVRLARGKVVRVMEWPYSASTPVRGPEGPYVNEMVLMARSRPPLVSQQPPLQRSRILRTIPPRPVAPQFRLRAPGADWIYLKAYLNAGAMDSFLINHLRPLALPLLDSGRIEKVFFIRYADPEPHLRIRLRSNANRPEVLERCLLWGEDLLKSQQIFDFTIGTYNREVARYGGPLCMEGVETIFHADSLAAISWLEYEMRHANKEPTQGVLRSWTQMDRLLFALWSADQTLRMGGLSSDERVEWTRTHIWSGVVSSERNLIRSHLAGILREKFKDPVWEFCSSSSHIMTRILRQKEARQKKAFDEIRRHLRRGEFEGSWDQFLTSLVHMQFNRLRQLSSTGNETWTEGELLSFMNKFYLKERHFFESIKHGV